MKALFIAAGILSLTIGVYKSAAIFDFLSHSRAVEATVLAVEQRTGPPKPRQNTPVHVRFTDPQGTQIQTSTALPFLQVLREGDVINLLSDTRNPQLVKIPLMSELWATPLTYVLVGMVFLLAGVTLLVKQANSGATNPIPRQ